MGGEKKGLRGEWQGWVWGCHLSAQNFLFSLLHKPSYIEEEKEQHMQRVKAKNKSFPVKFVKISILTASFPYRFTMHAWF